MRAVELRPNADVDLSLIWPETTIRPSSRRSVLFHDNALREVPPKPRLVSSVAIGEVVVSLVSVE